jgi:hypothetical protein
MNILNATVKHIMFGLGAITEEKDNKIWVQFQDNNETKMFLYPEAFEKFIKAENPEVQNNALEVLHIKQEQRRLEMERKAAELKEQIARSAPAKKKPARAAKK